jgi:hypothetical protein
MINSKANIFEFIFASFFGENGDFQSALFKRFFWLSNKSTLLDKKNLEMAPFLLGER